MIDIGRLWFTQHRLRRADQIPHLMRLVAAGEPFEDRIVVHECADGEVEIVNGHHRVTALWLSGLKELRRGEFLCRQVEDGLQRFWRVEDLRNRPHLLQSSLTTNGRSLV